MAALLGIDVDRVRLGCFALAGACAASAATLTLLIYGTIGIEGGLLLALKGLAAAVLGGIGAVGGAALGGLVIGLVEAMWATYVSGLYRDLAVMAVLITVLIFRPNGLFTRPHLQPNDRFRPR